MTNRSLPSTKCIIPLLPNTLILPPATPWAAMALEAPMTGEDCANDPTHLLPGYKAVNLYSFLSLPAELRMQICRYVLITPFALRLKGHLRAALGSDRKNLDKWRICRISSLLPCCRPVGPCTKRRLRFSTRAMFSISRWRTTGRPLG